VIQKGEKATKSNAVWMFSQESLLEKCPNIY